MVRRNVLRSMNLRRIGKSAGRYAAIVAIIALGSGFFTGLKVTNTAMIATGDRYLKNNAMFDYELISTLGWDDESVAEVATLEGIKCAEGSVSTDFLTSLGKKEVVLKALSITENINTLELVEGRMPVNSNECVVDSYALSGLKTGQMLKVSANNDEDTADMFAYDEYEIVGTVRSPLYINFERGTTTLGNGTVSAFVYIPREGFDTDYFTEMYVTLNEQGYIYSDEYENNLDCMEQPLTDSAEMSASGRKNRIVEDATQELNDAQSEYDDALKEYNDGLKEYEDGLKEYEDAVEELRDIQNYTSGMFNMGIQKINDMRLELDAQEVQLSEMLTDYTSQEQQLSGYIQYLQLQLSGVQNSEAADALQAQIDEQSVNLQALQTGITQIRAGLEQIPSGRKQLDKAYSDAVNSYSDAVAEFEKAQHELDDAWTELEDARQELEDGAVELADAEQKIADARQEVADIKEPDVYVLTRETNVGYACFENDANIVTGIANVFPFFFYAVAALVCITTVNRMISDERGQIGTLKALGYSSGKIMRGYLFYTGSASLLGCGIGVVSGSVVFPTVIWMAYQIMYSMPEISLVFDLPLMLASSVSYLMLSLAVTWFGCHRELAECAAELIRPKSPPPGKRIFLEYIPFIWKRMRFLRKVSFRNVFRYTKRLIMMVLGIGGCTALLLTGFGINDSITHIADRQFDEIVLYDAEVVFTDDISGEKDIFLEQCGEVIEDYAFLSSMTMNCSTEEATGKVTLSAVEDFSQLDGLIDFHYQGSPVPAPGDGECIVSENLVIRYGLDTGDVITLTDDGVHSISMRIAGVYENVINNYVYVNKATLDASKLEIKMKSVMLNFHSGIDVHEAGALVAGADKVANVQLTADTHNRVNSMLESMNYIIILIIACAAALAFIVLYNLTNINIEERLREIATIKVLGFRAGETANYVFRENIILAVCGVFAGIPMGILLHNFVMDQIKIDMMVFIARRALSSYMLAAGLTLIFTMLVNLIMKPRLEKINMAEALKSVE